MKFGLFGGAVATKSADTADSKGYDGFVDLIIEAEKLGYESIFMVDHHFTGGLVANSKNFVTPAFHFISDFFMRGVHVENSRVVKGINNFLIYNGLEVSKINDHSIFDIFSISFVIKIVARS